MTLVAGGIGALLLIYVIMRGGFLTAVLAFIAAALLGTTGVFGSLSGVLMTVLHAFASVLNTLGGAL
jgi:hypothetical protein